MELARECYGLSSQFPKTEMFGITQQLRRASLSVGCNVAEGHGRWHRKEFLQFLSISHGSLNEVEALLDLSEMLGYCTTDALTKPRAIATEVGRLLAGLRKSLQRQPTRTIQKSEPRALSQER